MTEGAGVGGLKGPLVCSFCSTSVYPPGVSIGYGYHIVHDVTHVAAWSSSSICPTLLAIVSSVKPNTRCKIQWWLITYMCWCQNKLEPSLCLDPFKANSLCSIFYLCPCETIDWTVSNTLENLILGLSCVAILAYLVVPCFSLKRNTNLWEWPTGCCCVWNRRTITCTQKHVFKQCLFH